MTFPCQIYSIEDPQGGRPPPHFYFRRFCRSVYRRTQSIRRSRNVKGNFAWGSYGGFSASSWRVLGTFSAESRQNLGEISLPLAMRCLGGPKTAPREPKGSQRVPKGSPKSAKGSQKGAKREAKGSPGGGKIDKNSRFFLARVSGGEKMGSVSVARFTFAGFWLHFGSILGAKFDDFSCYFLASFLIDF